MSTIHERHQHTTSHQNNQDGRNMDPGSSDQYDAIQMPNLRRLASKGTQFVRHYTNSPQCVPGRSVLWTGRRTNDIHVYNNGIGIAAMSNGTLDTHCIGSYNKEKCEQLRSMQSINYTMLDAMQSIGYDVHMIGKLHIGAGIMQMPIGENLTESAFQTADGDLSFNALTRSAGILKKFPLNESNESGPIKQINYEDPNPHADDTQFAQQCVERLDNLGGSDQASPFFLYCSIIAPHTPWNTNSTWIEGVNLDKIIMPNWNRSRYNAFDEYTSIYENLWIEDYSHDEIIDFRKTYYGLNVQADYLLGQVINASMRNGFDLSNTYFVFTSDHGEMNLDHRQVTKHSMFEGSARIPQFIAGPNIPPNVIKNLTETVDILPTLLSLGGETKENMPPWLVGHSLVPFLDGKVDDNEHPDYVTSQFHSNWVNTGLFMVRKGKYKYIQYGHYLSAYTDYKAQLFDLENDPNELNDISDANGDIVDEMEKILVERINYEYADCFAKQNDMSIFNEFIWNVYNQSHIYQLFVETYAGFNETDWELVKQWREELMDSPQCVP